VLAQGIRSSWGSTVRKQVSADYILTTSSGWDSFSPAAASAIASNPGVESVSSVRMATVKVGNSKTTLTGLDTANVTRFFHFTWVDGSNSTVGMLGSDGAILLKSFAKDHHLQVGSTLRQTFPSGESATFRVMGIFKPPTGGSPFGPVTISAKTWDRFNDRPQNLYSFVIMKGGETDANRAALGQALKEFPNAKVQTRGEFVDNQISGLSSVLNILYVLLALSILVSFFGIVNTLVLTVFERTREIGMLRAVGMTRRQVRRMIRHESVITSMIGGALGILLGIVLGGLLIARVDFIDFTLPIAQLIVFAVAAILVGVIAAIFPARRAARLNVLQALQYE